MKTEPQGRFAYEGLNRTIHEKARLGILTSLLTRREGLTFGDLKTLCNLTDGNLNRHLKALEEEGLITIHKQFEKNRPQTSCFLTEEGRARFLAYLQELERVIQDVAAATSEKKPGTGVLPRRKLFGI